VFEASAAVALGPDTGQNFGALFEVKDENGRVIMGCGFPGVYNTRYRNDRYNLQFYIRPELGDKQPTVEPIGRLDDQTGGAYMFDLKGAPYASNLASGQPFYRFDATRGLWQADSVVEPQQLASGDAPMLVGDGLLVFDRSGAHYKGQQILDPPTEGRYYCFYYSGGHLCFYHTRPGTEEEGRTTLYACPWTPSQQDPIDLSEAKTLLLKYSGETPFAFGQLRKETVTCSNLGGFYAFDGTAWKVVRPSLRGVSYQIYTMVNYYGRLLTGQYPTGNLIEYDGYNLTHLPDAPPVMEGVADYSRECQTSVIYRGELYVGVWPWAELWRLDADTGQWSFVQRMFSQPELTAEFGHPYEEDIVAYNKTTGEELVYNNWGQRITGMVSVGSDMILSTSAKGTLPRDNRLGFLTDEVFAEYGQFYRLHLPGNLSASIAPVSGPTQLRLVLRKSRMEIYRDGKLLAQTAVPAELVAQLRPATITWRYGVFGPFQGSLTRRAVSPGLEVVRPQREE
jgi:outer membrane protein assembly factor BamB